MIFTRYFFGEDPISVDENPSFYDTFEDCQEDMKSFFDDSELQRISIFKVTVEEVQDALGK
jgi:hypothetical protein